MSARITRSRTPVLLLTLNTHMLVLGLMPYPTAVALVLDVWKSSVPTKRETPLLQKQ